MKSILHNWKRQLHTMAWNTENEDGSMVKLIDKPHMTVLKIADFEDKDMGKLLQFPTTRRELLDRLQVRVVVFHDRIEVKVLFSVEPIYGQLCHPT